MVKLSDESIRDGIRRNFRQFKLELKGRRIKKNHVKSVAAKVPVTQLEQPNLGSDSDTNKKR